MSYNPWPPHVQDYYEQLEAEVGRSRVRLDGGLDERLEQSVQRVVAERDRLKTALLSIRALKPRRMGDHWTWEEGLKPDDVFDLVDEALTPTNRA